MGNNYYNVGEPKDFIIKFLNSQFGEQLSLDDQLEKLKTFSFWDIKDNQLYRNNKNYADGDCTNLAYAIAWCLWGDTLKKCYNCCSEAYSFKDLLDEKDFSGDTICTWNTLFNDPRIPYEIDFTNNEKEKILNFYKLYQSIGNFYLLPNRTVEGKSLNKYRGNYYGLKDYFDLFRELLKNKNDTTINSLINTNDFFFGECNKSWEILRDVFFLNDTEKLNFKEHFNHSQYKTDKKDDFKEHILDYVKQSTTMIRARAEIIVNELKKALAN